MTADRFTASEYHRMSAAEKRTLSLNVREAPVHCPACGTSTMVADLLAHVRERCAGRPDPHAHAVWVTRRQALELGLSEATLARALAAGVVRARGRRGARRLLLRDLVLEVARLAMVPTRARGRGRPRQDYAESSSGPVPGPVPAFPSAPLRPRSFARARP